MTQDRDFIRRQSQRWTGPSAFWVAVEDSNRERRNQRKRPQCQGREGLSVSRCSLVGRVTKGLEGCNTNPSDSSEQRHPQSAVRSPQSAVVASSSKRRRRRRDELPPDEFIIPPLSPTYCCLIHYYCTYLPHSRSLLCPNLIPDYELNR